MTSRSVLPVVDRTWKRPVWSVKMDLVARIQDAKMFCVIAPARLACNCCVGVTAGDCCLGGIVAGDCCVDPAFRLG